MTSNPPMLVRSVLVTLGWNKKQLGAALNRDKRTIDNWISGKVEPPHAAMLWMHAVLEAWAALPPPPKLRSWRAPIK